MNTEVHSETQEDAVNFIHDQLQAEVLQVREYGLCVRKEDVPRLIISEIDTKTIASIGMQMLL